MAASTTRTDSSVAPATLPRVFRQESSPRRRRGVELMEAHVEDLCRRARHRAGRLLVARTGDPLARRQARDLDPADPRPGLLLHRPPRDRSPGRQGTLGSAGSSRRRTPGSSRSSTASSSPPRRPSARSPAACAATSSGPGTASTGGCRRGSRRASTPSGRSSSSPRVRPHRCGTPSAPDDEFSSRDRSLAVAEQRAEGRRARCQARA